MLKKTGCKENDVVVLEIGNEAFTLAQMRKNGIMQFFDIVQPRNAWDGVDLNDGPSLFFIYVAEKNLDSLIVVKLDQAGVIPSSAAIPMVMLSAVFKGAGTYGADLIRLTDQFSSCGAAIIKADLDPRTDLDVIYRHELSGVYGDAGKIRKRLRRYFATGVNWDDSKELLFKGIALPPPHYGQSSVRHTSQ